MDVLVLGLVVIVGIALASAVIGGLLRAAFWLLFLPFRVVGWLLFLPLLLVKVAIGLVGLVLTPIVAVVAAVLAAIVSGFFVPLLPMLVIAGLVWLVVKVSRRPASRPVVS